MVQCTSSITAPKKAPPPLPPALLELRRLARINWGILFQAAVERHEEEVRRVARHWAPDTELNRIRRWIRELPVAAKAA